VILGNYRIGLIGAGAVGLYYASFFCESECSLTLITRDKSNYTDEPFYINSYLGDRSFCADKIIDYSDECEPFDLIIVATKVLPNIDFSKLISRFVNSKTVIFLIQNGIGIESVFNTFNQPIIRGLAFICAERVSYNLVQHFDFGQLSWGITNGDINQSNTKQFKRKIDATLMDQSLDTDISFSIWKKLLWNIPFNCLSIYYGGVDTSFLLKDTNALHYINNLMDEVITVAQSCGINLTNLIKSNHLKSTKRMKPYFTSMCLDFKAGRPIELDAILGNFIKIADKCNLDIPYSHNLYKNLLKMIS